MYRVSKYKGFRNFKTSYVLTIKFISKSKETPKLLLNIQNFFILQSNSTITKTTVWKLLCQKFTRDNRIWISKLNTFQEALIAFTHKMAHKKTSDKQILQVTTIFGYVNINALSLDYNSQNTELKRNWPR